MHRRATKAPTSLCKCTDSVDVFSARFHIKWMKTDSDDMLDLSPLSLSALVFEGVLALDWLQYLKQLFIKVAYHKLVASLTLMALF